MRNWFTLLLLALSLFCEGAEKIGTVTDLSGSLSATNQTEGQRTLNKKDDVYLGDTLMTNASGLATIKFTDGTSLMLIPNSSYSISAYSHGKVNEYQAYLQEGGIQVSTGLIAKRSPENFEIDTPDATIGVRGTSFLARLYGGELFVAGKSGTVKLTNQGGEILLKSNEYGMATSQGSAPQKLSERPSALDPSNFSANAANVSGAAALNSQMVSTSHFAWGPAVGALVVLGTVAGVVAGTSSQTQNSFSH